MKLKICIRYESLCLARIERIYIGKVMRALNKSRASLDDIAIYLNLDRARIKSKKPQQL